MVMVGESGIVEFGEEEAEEGGRRKAPDEGL